MKNMLTKFSNYGFMLFVCLAFWFTGVYTFFFMKDLNTFAESMFNGTIFYFLYFVMKNIFNINNTINFIKDSTDKKFSSLFEWSGKVSEWSQQSALTVDGLSNTVNTHLSEVQQKPKEKKTAKTSAKKAKKSNIK